MRDLLRILRLYSSTVPAAVSVTVTELQMLLLLPTGDVRLVPGFARTYPMVYARHWLGILCQSRLGADRGSVRVRTQKWHLPLSSNASWKLVAVSIAAEWNAQFVTIWYAEVYIGAHSVPCKQEEGTHMETKLLINTVRGAAMREGDGVLVFYAGSQRMHSCRGKGWDWNGNGNIGHGHRYRGS
jgi:hypothetical protein